MDEARLGALARKHVRTGERGQDVSQAAHPTGKDVRTEHCGHRTNFLVALFRGDTQCITFTTLEINSAINYASTTCEPTNLVQNATGA